MTWVLIVSLEPIYPVKSPTWQTLWQRPLHGAAQQYEEGRCEEVAEVDEGDGRRGVGRVRHLLGQLNADRGQAEWQETAAAK